MNIVTPILIGLLYCAAVSLVPEPARRRFNAIFVAGAGAAYLSSGALGPWELLHTGWDVVHHLMGAPILPFAPISSFGCAICDPVIALWCFAGGPSVRDLRRHARHDHLATEAASR